MRMHHPTNSLFLLPYRLYGCAEHKDCPFKFQVGRMRGGDTTIVVKAMTTTHKGRRREAKASDGRSWKTRRAGKYTGVISQIRQVKEKAPSAGDVMKAVATQQNETIDYGTAWRSLQGCEKIQSIQQVLSFRRIIPFLNKLSGDSPGSKIFSEKDPT